jgi:hypothetical protein
VKRYEPFSAWDTEDNHAIVMWVGVAGESTRSACEPFRAADWLKDRRCISRQSEVQQPTDTNKNIFGHPPKQPT